MTRLWHSDHVKGVGSSGVRDSCCTCMCDSIAGASRATKLASCFIGVTADACIAPRFSGRSLTSELGSDGGCCGVGNWHCDFSVLNVDEPSQSWISVPARLITGVSGLRLWAGSWKPIATPYPGAVVCVSNWAPSSSA
eukprot:scaffold99945_cov60-Phaeocystis_antarctica.AAC.3